MAACEKEAGQRDTNGFTARGASAQRHRSASLVEEEPASREAPQQHIAASSKRCPGKMLCPYEKELQLADGRTARMIAAALDNPALHAVSKDLKRRADAAPVRGTAHSTVHGRDCPGHRGCTTRVPSARVCGHHLRPAGTAQRTRDVYYLSHALPLHMNHQHKNPTSPPTTAITATDIPAIAPEERCVLLPVLLLPVLT